MSPKVERFAKRPRQPTAPHGRQTMNKMNCTTAVAAALALAFAAGAPANAQSERHPSRFRRCHHHLHADLRGAGHGDVDQAGTRRHVPRHRRAGFDQRHARRQRRLRRAVRSDPHSRQHPRPEDDRRLADGERRRVRDDDAQGPLGGITMATPLVERAKSLKGKKIAVDSPNSVVDGFLRYIAAKGGLDTARDLTVSYMQPAAMLAALSSGAIDAGVHTFPWTKTSQRQGDVLIASGITDVSELLPTTATSTTTRPDFCDQKPSVCAKLVHGYVLAHAFIHEHPKESIEVLKKKMPTTDLSDLESSFAEMRKTTPRVPSFSEASFLNAQKLMLVGGMMKEEEKLASFKDFYTNEFVK